jgi:hypothetical protein
VSAHACFTSLSRNESSPGTPSGLCRERTRHLNLAVTPCSCFLPVRQRHQFVTDFLQPLKSALVIRCAGRLFAASQVLAVRFPDLRYFFPQLAMRSLMGWGMGKG